MSATFFRGMEGWVDEVYSPEKNQKTERTRKFFQEKLQGGILIDVGGGNTFTMQDLAKKFGATKYINVDYWHGKPTGTLNPYIGRPTTYNYFRLPKEEQARPMEAIWVGDDMLDFVARLPDNSCNFVVNGIDDNVLEADDEYSKALIEELMRATKVGGIMFGIESEIWQTDKRFKSLAKELSLNTELYGFKHAVYEKIKE